MSKNKDLQEKEDVVLGNKVSSFLTNNIKFLKYIALAIVVIVIIIGIVNFSLNNKAEKNIEALDVAQTQFSSAVNANPESDTYQQDLDEALAALTDLKDEKGYVGFKSSYLLALNEFTNENYQAALESFIDISNKASGTYMGSLSLSNAAVCAEQLGDDSLVVEYCQQLIDTYGNDAAETPKTMFTLARIYEKEGNKELAQGQFQQLADQFPNSEYGKLAQNSLLNY